MKKLIRLPPSGIKNIQYSVGQKSNCCNQLAIR